METQLTTILIAAAVVIAGTFVLKKLLGSAVKLAGLMAVALLGRREGLGATGFDWVEGQDLTVIAASAFFGLIVGVILNAFMFKEDGFGRHFFVPLIAVAFSYVTALVMEL
jgi:hypothetical protein